MAKRKAARATKRKSTGRRPAAARLRSRASRASRTRAARKSTGRRAGAATRKRSRKAAAKTARRRTAARKAAARKVTRKAAASTRKVTRKRPASKVARRRVASRRPALRKTTRTASARKAPALERARRTVQEEPQQSPPSSLDMDRAGQEDRASRREFEERHGQRADPGTGITGGDVDGDWESAFNVGDEAPGGDNPTPDQDIVDDIGRAVGVRYDDSEELKGEKKITERDKKRWEMDPASSDDYDER